MATYNQTHYRDMARILSELEDNIRFEGTEEARAGYRHAVSHAVSRLVLMYSTDNPRFSVHRFLQAIHINKEGYHDNG